MDGLRLKELRKKEALNQTQLAKIIGVSPSAIGMYEQGRREPDHDTLLKLSAYFKVSADFLLGKEALREEKVSPSTEFDRDLIANEIFKNLTSENALMFSAIDLSEEDYEKIAQAIKLSVDLAMEKRKKKE